MFVFRIKFRSNEGRVCYLYGRQAWRYVTDPAYRTACRRFG